MKTVAFAKSCEWHEVFFKVQATELQVPTLPQ